MIRIKFDYSPITVILIALLLLFAHGERHVCADDLAVSNSTNSNISLKCPNWCTESWSSKNLGYSELEKNIRQHALHHTITDLSVSASVNDAKIHPQSSRKIIQAGLYAYFFIAQNNEILNSNTYNQIDLLFIHAKNMHSRALARVGFLFYLACQRNDDCMRDLGYRLLDSDSMDSRVLLSLVNISNVEKDNPVKTKLLGYANHILQERPQDQYALLSMSHIYFLAYWGDIDTDPADGLTCLKYIDLYLATKPNGRVAEATKRQRRDVKHFLVEDGFLK